MTLRGELAEKHEELCDLRSLLFAVAALDCVFHAVGNVVLEELV
jgi:hypothetical protein